MKSIVITVIVALILAIVGIGGTFYGKQLQDYYVKYYEKHARYSWMRPFINMEKSRVSLISTRIAGLVCLTLFSFLILALIFMLIISFYRKFLL